MHHKGEQKEKEKLPLFLLSIFGETQAVACCNWAAPAGRRYQLSLEELVAVFPGRLALTAALESLKVVSRRQRGAREPQNLQLLRQKTWKFQFTVTTGF